MKKSKRVSVVSTIVKRRRARPLRLMLAGRSPWILSLEEGLAIVNELFPMLDKPKLASWDFELARFPYGWSLNVTNSWHKWSAKKLKHDFGAYKKPEHAIAAFLEYVVANKIDVRGLVDKR